MELEEAVSITKQINMALGTIQPEQKEEIKKYHYIFSTNFKYKEQDLIIANKGIEILYNNNYDFLELSKKVKSRTEKIKRIKNRLDKMKKEQLWFCTWTIEEKYLCRDHTRKLKELYKGYNYIINVDYGTINERKHYHGVIESPEEPTSWDYGFCKMIKVKNNSKKLREYLIKLTYHTIKKTTKEERIIYSRTIKKIK